MAEEFFKRRRARGIGMADVTADEFTLLSGRVDALESALAALLLVNDRQDGADVDINSRLNRLEGGARVLVEEFGRK